MERIALIDGDEIAYKGAFACEQTIYKVMLEDKEVWRCKYKQDAIETIGNDKDLVIVKDVIPKGTIDNGHDKIDSLLSSFLFNTNSIEYKLFLSGPNNFRKKVATLAEYKGNRKGKPLFLNSMREYLQRLGAVTIDFLEADDCLSATQGNIDGFETVICTQDKDLKTVLGLNYNPRLKELTTITGDEARYNFYTQLLLGDSVDNIPHPFGIGKVFVEKALQPLREECASEEKYYSLVYEIYSDKLCSLKTKWYSEDMDINDILTEIGNLLYMHRTFDSEERWTPPEISYEESNG